MFKLISTIIVSMLLLNGCGGDTPPSKTDKTDNNSSNGTTQLLEGGTITNPTQLQFEKLYNVPIRYNTYVVINAKRFQHIRFEYNSSYRDRDTVYNRYLRGSMAISVYDTQGNEISTYNYKQDHWLNSEGDKPFDVDITFLSNKTYIIEFTSIVRNAYNGWCTVVAYNLGISPPEIIKNNQKYEGKKYKYYRLVTTKDGDISIHKSSQNNNFYIYDYDLNVLFNDNQENDLNVTLPKGSYLVNYRDCCGSFTIKLPK